MTCQMQVRKRPLNKKEISKKEEDIIDIEQRSNSLTVHETKLKVCLFFFSLQYLLSIFLRIVTCFCSFHLIFNVWHIISQVDLTEYVEKHEFVFDAVLDEDVSNDEVGTNCITFFISVFKYCKFIPKHCLPPIYRFIAKQWNLWFRQFLIERKQLVLLMDKLVYARPTLDTSYFCRILHIISTNILHSGSGKTYTMRPLPLKASQDILRLMHHTYRNQGFQLFVSFFEIYGGKLFDLLNDRR